MPQKIQRAADAAHVCLSLFLAVSATGKRNTTHGQQLKSGAHMERLS